MLQLERDLRRFARMPTRRELALTALGIIFRLDRIGPALPLTCDLSLAPKVSNDIRN